MPHDINHAFAELGLTSRATEAEVKAAWRRLVSQWHPDRNNSASAVAKMQRINRAVEAIRQAGLRAGGPAASAAAKAAEPAAPDRADEAPDDTPDDTPDHAPPQDDRSAEAAAPTIKRRVRLSLEEAAFGCTRVLRGKLDAGCGSCDGAGYRVLGGHCRQCHGSGAQRQRSWFGWVGAQSECGACHGGGIARQPCAECAGSGKAETRRYQLTVRFPLGVRDGDVLSVARRRAGPGAPPGDLSIRVELQTHDLLVLDDDGTLRCTVPVDGFAWIANRSIEVPTVGGLQTMQLQREQLHYRLKGQGFPVSRRGPRGDQIVTIAPIFPAALSTDQQILLDQLIAITSGPGARQPDERLRRWQQTLRASTHQGPQRR